MLTVRIRLRVRYLQDRLRVKVGTSGMFSSTANHAKQALGWRSGSRAENSRSHHWRSQHRGTAAQDTALLLARRPNRPLLRMYQHCNRRQVFIRVHGHQNVIERAACAGLKIFHCPQRRFMGVLA